MAQVKIEVKVSKSGAELVGEMLDQLGMRVRRDVDPCPRCAANDDPLKVPMHKNCRCWVEVVSL